MLHGVPFTGGASLKVEKAHSAARHKGLENPGKHEAPRCCPLEHSMSTCICHMIGLFCAVLRSSWHGRFATRFARITEGRECGVGSVVVDFRVFGAPRFSVQRPRDPLQSVVWDLWTENRGAPKTRNSTMTDPTPHSRPSENRFVRIIRN